MGIKDLKSNKEKIKFDVKLIELPVRNWYELQNLNPMSDANINKLFVCYTPLEQMEGYLILYIRNLNKKIPKKILRKLFKDDQRGAVFINKSELIGELKIEEENLNEYIVSTFNEWGEVYVSR